MVVAVLEYRLKLNAPKLFDFGLQCLYHLVTACDTRSLPFSLTELFVSLLSMLSIMFILIRNWTRLAAEKLRFSTLPCWSLECGSVRYQRVSCWLTKRFTGSWKRLVTRGLDNHRNDYKLLQLHAPCCVWVGSANILLLIRMCYFISMLSVVIALSRQNFCSLLLLETIAIELKTMGDFTFWISFLLSLFILDWAKVKPKSEVSFLVRTQSELQTELRTERKTELSVWSEVRTVQS